MADPTSPASTANKLNERLITSIEKRAMKDGAVLRYVLASYQERLDSASDKHPLLDLTHHLTDTFDDTVRSIRERMALKHLGAVDAAAKIEASVRNSLMRSAGTNYQALVSYAIARHLRDAESCWYVQHPVPTSFGQTLAIRFGPSLAAEATEGDDPATAADVVVTPDVDVLIRNTSFESAESQEPVLLLSVKTSLADRAGAAARWKTYFDIATQPCPHLCLEGCVYARLGITLANTPRVDITHGIVTANIYKINSDPKFTQFGELRTNQARANTYMFDLRYSTRNTSKDLDAPGWEHLTELPDWLSQKAMNFGLEG